jgi:hypothetical protein
MPNNALLHYSAAAFCAGVAFFGLFRDHRSFVHRIFALGMVILALESYFMGLSAHAIFPEQAVRWQIWRLTAAALLPGTWLLFSLSFGREDYRPHLAKWKGVVIAAFLLPLIFATILRADFFRDVSIYLPDGWAFGLGWSGYGFHICFLLSLVLLMMILERTLRSSKGRKRWQIKFFLLGLGALVDLELEVINALALLAANLLILVSIFRAGVLRMDIYFSHKVLYNSLTVLVVGAYFLALGFAAATMNRLLPFSLMALFIFFAIMALLIALLSERLRLKMKRLVSRHLRRPQYDYRDIWMTFTQRTTALVEEKALCEEVGKMISEMFSIPKVSLWLLDEKRDRLRCAGSTAFSGTQDANLPQLQSRASDLNRLLKNQQTLLDLEEPSSIGAEELAFSLLLIFQEARIRYLVPLAAGNDFLGFITLSDRLKG